MNVLSAFKRWLFSFCLCSKNFANTLQRVGGKAESILYEGKTHTDLFLQVRVLSDLFMLVFSLGKRNRMFCILFFISIIFAKNSLQYSFSVLHHFSEFEVTCS